MYYALTEYGTKVRPSKGIIGVCPDCGEELIPKCGDIMIWHWAHKSGTDCEVWSEGETDWHLAWKSLFPESMVKVSIEKKGVKHRADVLTSRGVVIELQHSPISPETICEREDFYGDMIWLFDTMAAWEFDRIKMFEKTSVKGNKYISFYWKNAKKSLSHAKKDMLWDLDGKQLFKPYAFNGKTGWGHITSKSMFINQYVPTNYDLVVKKNSLPVEQETKKQLSLF